MKFYAKFIIIVFVLYCSFSCARKVVTMSEGDTWLQSMKGIPNMSVNGNWNVAEWGTAVLKQQGDQVTGSLGGYSVNGIVAGTNLYMVLSSSGEARYTVHFKKETDQHLTGYWAWNIVTMEEKDKWPIKMTRLE